MGKFIKKPTVIEAVKFTRNNVKEVLAFIGCIPSVDYIAECEEENQKFLQYCDRICKEGIKIYNNNNETIAYLNDYIVKGSNGEFHSYDKDIFEKRYMECESGGYDNEKMLFISASMKEDWARVFYSALKRMEKDGKDGHSEIIEFFSDGDGDFRPRFKFSEALTPVSAEEKRMGCRFDILNLEENK